MKQIIALILFISIVFLSFGQKDDSNYINNSKDFFESNFNPTGSPALAENLDTSTFLYIKQILSKDTFCKRITYDHGATIIIDTFILTKQERGIVDSFFSNYRNFAWQNNSFVNYSAIIGTNTMDSLRTNNISLFNYLYKKYNALSLLFMSKPIFLRNNTICIFYYKMLREPLGGGYSLTIYRKIHGKWKRYQTLSEMVS